MKKKLLFWALLIAIFGAFFIGAKTSKATVQLSNGQWVWTDTSSCEASQCGTSEGTKRQSGTCEFNRGSNECNPGTWVDPQYEYADGICPDNYHWQNYGNWNQRCHRNHFWMHPEHKAPIGCPAGFNQVEDVCRKTIAEGYWRDPQTTTRTISCNDAPIIPCPVDCQWHWSECSASCGDGVQTVVVDTPPANGGAACPTNTQQCNNGACSTRRWCTPNESDGHPYRGIAVPVDQYPPDDGGKPWETGMDKWCEFGNQESPSPSPTPIPTSPSCGADEHLDLSGTKCLKWELGGPPPVPPAGGEVLGTSSAGQVLGVTGMASTGVAEDSLFSLIFILGCLTTSFGVRKLASSKA